MSVFLSGVASGTPDQNLKINLNKASAMLAEASGHLCRQGFWGCNGKENESSESCTIDHSKDKKK